MNQIPSIATTAFVGADVEIATNVRIGPGAAVYGPSRLESGVRIDANATIAAPAVLPDEKPEGLTAQAAICLIGENVTVGAGAVIYPGVTINAGAVIAPATLVQRNVPPLAHVSGNPASIVGYLNTPNLSGGPERAPGIPNAVGVADTGVGGATIHTLPHIRDLRGDLSVGEFDSALPFKPLRYFLVFDVPS